MELQPPTDRDLVLKKNLLLRKEQAARVNLNVDPLIQKCFHRLHRNVTGKVEWRGNAIIINDRIIIDKDTNYRRAEMDLTLKSDSQQAQSAKYLVDYINKVLESFWSEQMDNDNLVVTANSNFFFSNEKNNVNSQYHNTGSKLNQLIPVNNLNGDMSGVNMANTDLQHNNRIPTNNNSFNNAPERGRRKTGGRGRGRGRGR